MLEISLWWCFPKHVASTSKNISSYQSVYIYMLLVSWVVPKQNYILINNQSGLWWMFGVCLYVYYIHKCVYRWFVQHRNWIWKRVFVDVKIIYRRLIAWLGQMLIIIVRLVFVLMEYTSNYQCHYCVCKSTSECLCVFRCCNWLCDKVT